MLGLGRMWLYQYIAPLQGKYSEISSQNRMACPAVSRGVAGMFWNRLGKAGELQAGGQHPI